MKLISSFFLLVIMFLIFEGCTSYTAKDVPGVYFTSSPRTHHLLKLSPDSSFVFDVHVDLSIDTAYGKWSFKDGRVRLKRHEDEPYYVVNQCTACKELCFSVFDITGKYPYNASYRAFANNNLVNKGMADDKGHFTINEKIDSVFLKMLNCKPFGFRINVTKGNIEVFMLDQMNNYYHQNEWKLKKNGIEYSDGLFLDKIKNLPDTTLRN